jgi:hypothetical protein
MIDIDIEQCIKPLGVASLRHPPADPPDSRFVASPPNEIIISTSSLCQTSTLTHILRSNSCPSFEYMNSLGLKILQSELYAPRRFSRVAGSSCPARAAHTSVFAPSDVSRPMMSLISQKKMVSGKTTCRRMDVRQKPGLTLLTTIGEVAGR